MSQSSTSGTGVPSYQRWLAMASDGAWQVVARTTKTRPRWWPLAVVGAAVVIAVLGATALGWAGLVLAPIAAGAAVAAELRRRRRARLQECRAALPDALSLMAAGLSAGHTLQQSVSTAVRSGGPLAPEFARVQMLIRLGETVPDALAEMAGRLDSTELAWVVVAVRINSAVGGDLGALLTTIAETLRERETLRRTARVLAAEGRLSAWVLGILPIAFVGIILVARPEHLAPLVADGRGWTLIGLAVVLFTVGVLWLRRAARLEV